MRLNQPKNFFRMRQARASLLSAEELSEDNDMDDVDETDDTTTGVVDTASDDETSKTGGEGTTFTESRDGSDHDDV